KPLPREDRQWKAVYGTELSYAPRTFYFRNRPDFYMKMGGECHHLLSSGMPVARGIMWFHGKHDRMK
ncbi:MAG: hypothetical protein KO206_03520, partial [Methanomicrobiaceae archaeon]|nr:hypothetical protein [Methanomicrobiaceae archaeon]